MQQKGRRCPRAKKNSKRRQIFARYRFSCLFLHYAFLMLHRARASFWLSSSVRLIVRFFREPSRTCYCVHEPLLTANICMHAAHFVCTSYQWANFRLVCNSLSTFINIFFAQQQRRRDKKIFNFILWPLRCELTVFSPFVECVFVRFFKLLPCLLWHYREKVCVQFFLLLLLPAERGRMNK